MRISLRIFLLFIVAFVFLSITALQSSVAEEVWSWDEAHRLSGSCNLEP